MIERRFVLIEGETLCRRLGGETADGGDDVHIRVMLAAFLKAGKGVDSVADVNDDRGVNDVQMQRRRRDLEKSAGLYHVTNGTVRVGAVFHEELPGAEDQLHFAVDVSIGSRGRRGVHG